MRAEILCVGTELLLGDIVNTNATWLAQELATLGVDLLWISTVGDNMGRLVEAIDTGTLCAVKIRSASGIRTSRTRSAMASRNPA